VDAEAWRQAKDVLAEALSCPANEREAFVAARCQDPALRRELQGYLNQYDEDFLESVLTVSQTFESSASAADDGVQVLDIQPGDRIGHYVVVDRLGVGGMGHVFLGNDTQLQRKVALKGLVASASASELRSRILHEARAAARLTHPNIAVVHDVIDHDGRPFLVMEYVEGETLAAMIKRERLPLHRILTMLRQLASALAAAHGKGIVHRDLKPANIQVTPDGSVKILDFGVAHAITVAATNSPSTGAALTIRLTSATVPADARVMHPGTPAYMSPEQMFGREIDQRSDIYSLGIVAYEMATGHRPYATNDPLEVVLTVSKNFLSTSDLQASVPAQLNDVIAKMLAVNPAERYQTAGELSHALDLLTAATGPASVARTSPRVRIARVTSTAVVALFGITLLGYIETRAFNLTLGRTSPFGSEPPWKWLQFGAQSLVMPGVYALLYLLALWAARFVGRLLSLSKTVDRLRSETATKTARVSRRIGLDDPAVFGQAVVALGVVALVVIVWRHRALLNALGSMSISTRPRATYLPFQSFGRPRADAQWYQFLLVTLALGFGTAALRLRRLRAAQALGRGGGALGVVLLMMCITIVVCELPYGFLYRSEMVRVDAPWGRCFLLGQSGEDLLIHCPDGTAPRNHTVKRSDPGITMLGESEKIFDPPRTPSDERTQ
jgi:serine/threonine protein kinase